MRLDEFPSARAHRPLYERAPKRRRRWYSLVLRALGIVMLLLIVLTGAAALLIASGPVELNVIRDRVVATVQARLGPGYAVKVAGASIDVDPVLGLVAEIDEVTVRDDSNAVVARIPATRLAIDPLSFLKLRVDIRTVEISNPEISLVRGKTGRIYLGNADTVPRAQSLGAAPASDPAQAAADKEFDRTDGGFPNLVTALRILNGALDPVIDAAFERNFERFAVDAGTIQIWDARKLQQRTFPHTDLSLTVDAVTRDIKASFTTSGYAGRWGILAERSVDPATQDRTFSLSFSQLTLADFEPNFGRPESLLTSDIPLYGRATVRLSVDGVVRDAQARFDFGAGTMVSGFGKDTILLDEATVRLHWDVARRVLVVNPSTFFFGDTRAMFTGEIRPLADPSDGRYAYSFESRGPILAARDANAPPIMADRISLSGTADFPAKRIDINEAAISSAAGSVAAAGSLGLDGPTPSLSLAASFTPMSLETLKQMWPPILAGPARKWFMEHVEGGRVAAGRFVAAVPPGVLWTGERVTLPEDYMRLDARLEDVSFTTIGTVPPITNASGNAVVAGSTFGIDLESGQIAAPSGKTVKLTAGAFAVPNTALPQPSAQIELQGEGDIGAMAEISNSEPLRAMDRQKLDPTAQSGNATFNLSIKLPLKPGLLPSDVDWRVSLQTEGFASAVPIEGKTIKNGNFALNVDAREITIKGKASINGVPASIDLVQPLGEGEADGEGGRRQVRLVLDADARKRLGIGLDNVLGGTVGAIVNELSDGRKGQHYELDLKQARLVLQAVGWSKGVGVPAKLSFDMLPVDDGYLIDNMVATGDGFGLKGKAKLDSKFGLVSANLERLALRKGDQISVDLQRKGNGYAIVARGSSFDARGLITAYKSRGGGSDDGGADLSVNAKVDKLIGFDQTTLSGASIAIVASDGVVQKMTLDGDLPRGPVSLSYVDKGSSANLDLESTDAGGLLGFVDLYGRMNGGRLTLSGSRSGASGPFSGMFDVTNFSIVGEDSMKKLVSASTGTGADATPTGIDPSNVPFGRMRLDYTKRGSLIVIEDAVLRGASVGATMNGTLDLARQRVSLVGTYLPAYAFNNLFGRVPLLGLALGGGSQGGLFGVTFKIDGPMNAPNLTVNPLSMITPGIFRKIFEFPVD